MNRTSIGSVFLGAVWWASPSVMTMMAQALGVYPRTMSHFAASSPIFEPLSGAKSRQSVSWPFGSRARICWNWPSRSLLGKPLMKHSVVSSFLSPFQIRAWICAAGRPAVGDGLDRPEVVFAGRTGQEAAVSLEVRVELLPVPRVLLK